jgi:biopolymer transport protein ExbD
VLVGVLLMVPCLVAVLLGAYFVLGVSRQAVVVATPTAPIPTAIKMASPMRIATIMIGADEALTLDGAAVTLDALPDQLRQLRAVELSNGSSLSVAVHSDPATPFDVVQRVLTKISETGVPYTLQSTVGGPVGGGMPGMAAGETAAEMPAKALDTAVEASAAEPGPGESSETEESPADTPDKTDEKSETPPDNSVDDVTPAGDASAETTP